MQTVQHVGVVIIGAGPTGIGAALDLHNSGYNDWLLIDAASGPGGMAATNVDDKGFRWDLGGHVIHSHFQAFDDLAIKVHKDWVHPKRSGWVRVGGVWCPTPIQRNLGSLPGAKAIAQEISQKSTSYDPNEKEPTNLEEYYVSAFGPSLNNIFFEPFNSKQWAWPLSQLSHTWTSLRAGSKERNVPVADTGSALIIKTKPEDTNPFEYPRLGTGSLWKDVAEDLPSKNQLYSTSVTSVDLSQRILTLNNGTTIHFARCITTIPLSAFTKLVINPTSTLTRNSLKLRCAETNLVGLGFEGPIPAVLEGKTWIFSADRNVWFHRASIPSTFSQSLAGPNRWSIMFETSLSHHRPCPDVSALPAAHLAELARWGITAQPVSIWTRHLKFGYPLPFSGRDTVVHDLLSELEESDVFSRGRFGGWRYESSNQDYAFQQGIEIGTFLRTGDREKTFWDERPGNVRYVPLQ